MKCAFIGFNVFDLLVAFDWKTYGNVMVCQAQVTICYVW